MGHTDLATYSNTGQAVDKWTAESVRELVMDCSRRGREDGDGCWHIEGEPQHWQRLADELNAAIGRQKAKAHPYGYEPDTGAFDVTRCECGCLNDISATYCNDCGGVIEVDVNAEKEIYKYSPRNSVFATKHDDGSLEFGGKRYVAATLGDDADAVAFCKRVERAVARREPLTLFGVDYSATLSGGELTAEQVYKAVMSADRWVKPIGNTGLTNTHLIIRDGGWQVIADELNRVTAEATAEEGSSRVPVGSSTWTVKKVCDLLERNTYADGRTTEYDSLGNGYEVNVY